MSRPALNHDAVYAKQDPVDYCLDCWREYMWQNDRQNRKVTAYYASDVEDGDVNERQRAADYKIGEAVLSELHDMPLKFRWAIYKVFGIGNVFNFHSLKIEDVYPEARCELARRLKKNRDTSHKF